ncbi:hypothetical protein Pla52o_33070 [Novipirellula galeiformis]|uniref:Uncharacterized protein n=1 Tax=Novipirellula galeiformis TaxID=2528004 RepID=A0A5C6CFU6_9BACT|nr:hypothetical protein Pla52o_33070 [Novipirellula galeiformis]
MCSALLDALRAEGPQRFTEFPEPRWARLGWAGLGWAGLDKLPAPYPKSKNGP